MKNGVHPGGENPGHAYSHSTTTCVYKSLKEHNKHMHIMDSKEFSMSVSSYTVQSSSWLQMYTVGHKNVSLPLYFTVTLAS